MDEGYSLEDLDQYYKLRGKRKAKAEAEKPEAEEKPRERKPFPIDELRGRKAVWVLRGGLKIEGILRNITPYEIVLEDGNHKYLVFKHAIDYVIY